MLCRIVAVFLKPWFSNHLFEVARGEKLSRVLRDECHVELQVAHSYAHFR
jgi:hypothetical protein